jgi:hypothetical protein
MSTRPTTTPAEINFAWLLRLRWATIAGQAVTIAGVRFGMDPETSSCRSDRCWRWWARRSRSTSRASPPRASRRRANRGCSP